MLTNNLLDATLILEVVVMTSLDVMTILSNEGYTVEFEKGFYKLSIGNSPSKLFTKLEVITLVNDIKFVRGLG